MFVLQNESPEIFQQLLDCCVRRFQPQDELEMELVLEIASARWRLRRLWTIETAMFDAEMDRQDERLRREFHSFDEPTRQAEAFTALAESNRGLSLLTRYETRLRRAYERAVESLRKLQEERAGRTAQQPNTPEEKNLQNEPEAARPIPADEPCPANMTQPPDANEVSIPRGGPSLAQPGRAYDRKVICT
jgi:hypothetical protein